MLAPGGIPPAPRTRKLDGEGRSPIASLRGASAPRSGRNGNPQRAAGTAVSHAPANIPRSSCSGQYHLVGESALKKKKKSERRRTPRPIETMARQNARHASDRVARRRRLSAQQTRRWIHAGEAMRWVPKGDGRGVRQTSSPRTSRMPAVSVVRPRHGPDRPPELPRQSARRGCRRRVSARKRPAR